MDIDLEFISNPSGWPLWPYLPLIRGRELAVLMHSPRNGQYTIFENANVYDMTTLILGYSTTPAAVVAAGWVVD